MNLHLPSWLKFLGIAALAALALLVFTHRDRMDVYGTYIRQTSPSVEIRLADLSVAMDEAAVRKHFDGVPLQCVAQASGPDILGERVCYAQIDRADGQAALMLATFFNQGHLVRAVVQVPWWVHGVWIQRFTAQWGQPVQAGRVSLLGGPILRWKVANGQVEFNRDRSFNPLDWNVIVWTGRPS